LLPPSLLSRSINRHADITRITSRHHPTIPFHPNLISPFRFSITANAQIQLLVRAYQVRGHHKAKLDPLGILQADLDNKVPVELTLEHYGWSEQDLDKEFSTGPGILPHFKAAGITKMTLREIINTMERIYCGWR
jgi:2-oxoglutarate dehydrogenase complex dehydrogenase (E1) component-like enzyme